MPRPFSKGVVPKFTAEEIEEAKKQLSGGDASSSDLKATPEEIEQAKRDLESGSTTALEKGETAIRSGLKGATYGMSEPIISGGKAAVQSLYDPRTRGQLYDADVDKRRDLEKKLPNLALGSEMTGMIAPAFMSGGATLPLQVSNLGAKGVSKMVGALVKKIPGMEGLLKQGLSEAGKRAAPFSFMGSGARIGKGAVEGAAVAGADHVVREKVGEASGFIKEGDARGSVQDSMKFGSLIGGGLHAVPEAFRGGKSAVKSLMSTTLGMKKPDIDTYLSNPAAVNNAPSMGDLKGRVDAFVENIRSKVEKGTIEKSDAKEALREAELNLRAKLADTRADVRVSKYEINDAFKDARDSLEKSFAGKLETLKAHESPAALAPEVSDSLEALKTKFLKKSEDSYKQLDSKNLHPDKTIRSDLRRVPQVIDEIQEGFKIKGQALSHSEQQAINELERLKIKFKTLAKEPVPFETVKDILKSLSKDINRAGDKSPQGGFNSDTFNALQDLRFRLNSYVGGVFPKYAEEMKEVYRLHTLLKEGAKKYGTPSTSRPRLARIDGPHAEEERKLLIEIGKETGKDFEGPLNSFMENRKLLKNGEELEKLKQSLPEFFNFDQASKANATAKHPSFGNDLEEYMYKHSPEARAVTEGQSRLQLAEGGLESAKAKAEPFSGLTPKTSENMIQGLMGDPQRKLEVRAVFERIAKMDNANFGNFMKEVESHRIKRAFTLAQENGSKHVNFWGAIGGILGGVTSHGELFTSATAGTAGLILGQYVSKHGPAITKKMLDGYARMHGMPSVAKIRRFMPVEVQENLINDLVMASQAQGAPVQINQADYQSMLGDLDKASNLSTIDKAKAFNQMNRQGTIPAPTLQKMMLDDGQGGVVQPRPDSFEDEDMEDLLEQLRDEE